MSQQQQMAEIATQAALDCPQDLIPARYGDPTSSEITTRASSNNFPIELKD